jgi:putative Mn2+ efflux pump MntP
LSTEFFQFIAGAILLSVVHALIPNHWIPYVLISRSEKWSTATSLRVTAVGGFAHTLSTVIIGILIGLLGYQLNNLIESISSFYAPVILISFGLIYVIIGIKNLLTHSHSHHHHHEHIEEDKIKELSKKSFTAITLSLSTAMFFSPCIEIEAYYFTAGTYGWMGIAALSLVYVFMTVAGMLILVSAGRKSLNALDNKMHFLEHYEKLITGSILVILGIISYFIEF